eukprot:Platyproteum_vivax@DN12755_c0_g1_i1.p1
MMTEKDKMLSGQLYDASDGVLVKERLEARDVVYQYNHSLPSKSSYRVELLKKLFGKTGKNIEIEPSFNCDYGYNIKVGENFYANFNCVILDVMEVNIGNNVMLGPAVQIYTATHPLDPTERSKMLESAKPISIGNEVWIGGGAIILPGVCIGNGVTIGAGSIVTKDIPDRVFAAGNPCK